MLPGPPEGYLVHTEGYLVHPKGYQVHSEVYLVHPVGYLVLPEGYLVEYLGIFHPTPPPPPHCIEDGPRSLYPGVQDT